jgi:LuxR family transcriptional regulator, maltose regulon positive regulatory protein
MRCGAGGATTTCSPTCCAPARGCAWPKPGGTLIGGRLEAVEPLVADAERGLAAVAEEPYEPSVGRAASTLANAPAAIAVARANLARLRGNAERTSEFGQQALAQLTEDDRMLRFQVGLYLAVADWLRGQLPEAEQALGGLAEQLAAGARYLGPLVPLYHDLGQVQRARGHLSAALRTYQNALGIAAGRVRPR